MIHDKDRSGWFGASDTAKIMGRWDTRTFELFWAEKLGLHRSTFSSLEMKTGSYFEGKILDAMGVKRRDRQIRIPSLRLRVNLDGENRIIHEVKTYKAEEFKVSRPYWMQAQVEMFAARKGLEIAAYRLEEEDYGNWLRPIDPKRISHHPIERDEVWLQTKYLPRLAYLADCLKRGVWPDEKPC